MLALAREAVARCGGMLVMNTALAPLYDALGGANTASRRSAAAEVDALNLALRELVATDPVRIALADWVAYSRQLGEAETYDRRFWFSSGAPFGRRFLARYARDIAAPLRITAGKVRKCLVLDCDNTLWGGVVGEDGLDGIQLSADSAPGVYFREFQRAVLDLHARGVAIALASKNNEADVMDVLERHPCSLLRREHLSAWRINWEEKPVSLAAIAAELNLGLDALVFIDDNPMECELVTKALPQVQVLQVPPASEELVTWMQRNDPFAALAVTTADRERNASYRQNRQRDAFSAEVGDLTAYKRQIGAELRVRGVGEADVARVAQLLQRSNQFNLTTRRYGLDEVRAILVDKEAMVLCAELKDRFGDLGLIGVAIIRRGNDRARIDSLLMSCRALGRDAELAFAAALYGKIATTWKSRWIEAEFVASAKNAMVADFWVRAGLLRSNTDPEGDVVVFHADADAQKLHEVLPDYVKLTVEP
ncbi:MAG: HAD-IIIC family phosphatase [Proteobacteria bacterium]|nr:HAD-IIIC family phosphatase [Pseudomonadota bacterium]